MILLFSSLYTVWKLINNNYRTNICETRSFKLNLTFKIKNTRVVIINLKGPFTLCDVANQKTVIK